MRPLLDIFKILLDALFPLSPAESELFSLSPQEACARLDPAPGFSGLAVPLPGAISVFAYKDERAARLVWNIKYKKSARAVGIGGYALSQALGSIPIEGCALVLPMPITPKRRKERGYNQCELLLEEIERSTKEQSDLSMQPNMTRTHYIFEKMMLIRAHHASRQTLKGRTDRLESAKGIFRVDPAIAKKFIDKHIPVIIIDDVITTGSTMHEALETLKRAGFSDVRALSLAH